MSRVTVDIPDESMSFLSPSPERTLRKLAAIKLFEMGRLSSGAAARLADMPRTVFLASLADYGVNTFDLSEEDLEAEAYLGPPDL